MRARRTGFTTIAAALTVAALVAVLGAAQAAPSTKKYDATVHVTTGDVDATSATLTLTLTNDTASKQTLGSANFTPPAGIDPTGVISDTSGNWTVGLTGDVVTFRSTSALTKGQSVSADVEVSISQTTCTNATWSTEAKQSNDFSGTGNDFALNSSLSNLRPLGSFDFEPIGTQVSTEIFAPQILVSVVAPVDLTAFDICGDVHTGYGSGFGDTWSLAAFDDTPDRLVGADISGIEWGSGAGSATVEPVVVETGDKLVVSDGASGISATSDEFDVVEKICTSLDTMCEWDHGNGKIHAEAAAPPDGEEGEPDPNLGIGFNGDLSFDCGGTTTPVGGTLVNINPRDYPEGSTVTITLTYVKSITGNGPASSFDVCLSKNNGLDWDEPLDMCPSDEPVFDDAPCILEQKRTTGGALLVVLFIKAEDPWTGLG